MGIAHAVFGTLGKFIRDKVKKAVRFLFKRPSNPTKMGSGTAGAAAYHGAHGRGTIRWKDYHPTPPAPPRKKPVHNRE